MKIWKQYNKQKKCNIWHARFRVNKKQFFPTAETKADLEDLITEIRSQEKTVKDNQKFNLTKAVVQYIPALKQIFEEMLPKIQKHHQRKLSERVFGNFLSLLPPTIKINELKTYHFQLYINYRKGQLAKVTRKPVTLQTVYKELYAITSCLKDGAKLYESLEDWKVPQLPELPKGFKKKSKRERLVTDKELFDVIEELMKKPTGKQTYAHYFHRVRLAHTIEFGFWTGLRRKEIATLKFSQYDSEGQSLLNVKRHKTDTVTKFFPLAKRAIEIINERKSLQSDCEYIFTDNGTPIESSYRTLRNVCENLNIPYGKYKEDGFIFHDLRHNFATGILQTSDIETARELLGHSNITQTGTYVHTSEDRLREAVRKRDRIDYNEELSIIFEGVKTGKLNLLKFAEKTKSLFGF